MRQIITKYEEILKNANHEGKLVAGADQIKY